MDNGVDFWKGLEETFIKREENRKEPKTLKDFIQEMVGNIEFNVIEVFNNEFLYKPLYNRIYAWEVLNDIPQLKKQLLKEAWFQDVNQDDELYYNDETNELDYENIHEKMENEYKIVIDGSINMFLSYRKLYPQIRKINVEVEVKELKNEKKTRKMNELQMKIDFFVKNKKEEILNE